MTLDEYRKTILDTSYDDWNSITCWGAGSGPSYKDQFTVWTKGTGDIQNIEVQSHAEVLVLKSNLLVSISFGLPHNEDFVEKWTEVFADRSASSSYVDFFYSNQLIYRDIYVVVDGGRCCLPLPELEYDQETLDITSNSTPRDKYQVFKLLNGTAHDYDSFINRAGITVTDKPWMT